ncbi:AAA family ATPase [Streptomyces sp. NBC_01304]|uniref:AAA family ATPase n=1 Tax=Streptomyces sp. NBC_01304 TaxID=2903818 RepID=UPI002E105D00|nr:AAA family ATPase [Streptomyces sp. NBC_01304]
MDDASPPHRAAAGPSPGGTPPLLRVHLFGGFRVEREGGAPLADKWPRPSARALVKLLAVSPGHALHREQAMEICWPDADPGAALGSLRVALHAARRAIEPELAPRAASSYLTGEGALLRLDPAAVWIDADHAEGLAGKALAGGGAAELAAALDAFTGELLPEDRYAAWAEPRRERLGALRERVLLGLAGARLTEGDPEAAAAAAEQVLVVSPAEEQAHQVLIEAYARQGLRRRAVRQYHLCREALDAEFGVRPGPATERLHQAALAASAPAVRTAPPVLPAALRTAAATPLRGRDSELASLLAPDAPPVQLLTGEAGLGKTRLAGEAARRAAAGGAAVLWGAGHDAEGHTPYGPFAEALDGWLADRPAAERARAGAEYPELAALLPSLGRVRTTPDRSPEEERDRLFRATAGLLAELAAQQPVFLVLDDLHAADAGSFQLLSHLARRAADTGARCRFAVTYREEELGATDTRRAGLAALERQGLARRIGLGRLDRAACLAVAEDAWRGAGPGDGEAFCGGAFGGDGAPSTEAGRTTNAPDTEPTKQGRRTGTTPGKPETGTAAGRTDTGAATGGTETHPAATSPDAETTRHRPRARAHAGPPDSSPATAPAPAPAHNLARVWDLSLGNPLFAIELARVLGDGTPAEELGAPEGVRQLVGERFARLGAAARRMVEVVAVAGGEAPLGEVLDVAARGLHPPLGQAEAAEALDTAVAASLIAEREVVIGGRPAPGLAFRHPLVRLTCYEQLSGIRRRQLHSAFAEAVLRLRPAAVDALASHFARADDPRAAEYLRRAAERAAALYANDTADRYYRDLVARLDVDAARARLAHSQVLRRMGHFAEATTVLRKALAEFELRGERDDEVLAAAQLAETLVKSRTPELGGEVLRNYAPRADTAPQPAAAHHVAQSVVHFVLGRYEDAYESARRAQDSAGRVTGAPGQGLVARALAMQASSLGLAGRFAEARAAADQALAPAEAYGDPTLLTSVLSILRENARRGGRLHEAIAMGRRALDLAEQSGDPTAAAFERANLAELHLLVEEFDEAGTLAEAAVHGAESDGEWCLPYALAALARVRMRTDEGDAAALLARAEQAATDRGDRQARHEVRTARAELALRQGRPAEVADLVDAHSAPLLAAWAHALAGRHAMARELAETEAALAEAAGERVAEVELRVVRALALAGLGEHEAARAGFAEAATLAAGLPYPAGVSRVAQVRDMT